MAQQQLSTNTFTVAKWIVSADATQGTHTTIGAAITSASSGDTIYIRDGTYTENLTLKAGVDLVSLTADAFEPNVIINGKCTFTGAGTVSLSGIELQTNSDFCLAVTGSAASIVNLIDCYVNALNNTAISFSTSSSSAQINLTNCQGNLATTGIAYFSQSSAGTLYFDYCYLSNNGASTTASTSSAGNLSIRYSFFSFPITTSSSNILTIEHSSIQTSATNTTSLTHNSTGANCSIQFTFLSSGTATALSLGAGATLVTISSAISSLNTNAVNGTGTLTNAGIFFSGSSSLVNSGVTQSAKNLDVGGITFDGGNNILSNYVVPTSWTPALNFGGSTTGITYTTQAGTYTRVGNLIYFAVDIC